MKQLLWIALAGAAGALGRHGVTLAAARATEIGFPFGTLTVNVVGSVLLGVLLEGGGRAEWSDEVRLALGTGFLGAFTTFSTFSVDTVKLYEAGRYVAAAGNVGANLALGLAGAALGFWIARQIW